MKTRLICKLEIKGTNVVKPIYFEGLKVVGKIKGVFDQVHLSGVDEIIYLDIVSSLYQRKLNLDLLRESSKSIFVPLTVGGGINSIEDCNNFFANGADKISINTYALQTNQKIINEIAKKYGSQSLVLNVEAKKIENEWICYSDNGRCPSNKKILEWIQIGQDLGVGEILLQSVDRDGSKKGFDLELYKKVVDIVKVPLIVASGFGKLEHIENLVKLHKPQAICLSSLIYENKNIIKSIKSYLDEQ